MGILVACCDGFSALAWMLGLRKLSSFVHIVLLSSATLGEMFEAHQALECTRSKYFLSKLVMFKKTAPKVT
jgi:hypothetical protein